MTHFTKLTITTALSALFATSAVAAVGVQDIDLDNDDFASFDELTNSFPGITQEDFDLIDDNNDNRISSKELYDTKAQNILARHDFDTNNAVNVDMDGDGFASYEEMTVVFDNLTQNDFELMDTNDDNRLSQFEIYDTDAQNILARYPFMESVRDVRAIDKNSDNFLSFMELQGTFPEMPEVEFEKIDMNNDNRVSFTELYDPEAQEIVSKYGN